MGNQDNIQVVPNYEQDSQSGRKAVQFFSDDGIPLVASAREIAPDADNPLPFWVRYGERLHWVFTTGLRTWPLNVRNNVLLYYLLGRRKGSFWETLIILVPWMVFLGFESFLFFWVIKEEEYALGFLYLLISFIFVAAAYLVGFYSNLAHADRQVRCVPFEQLRLTRLSADEVLYALYVRPVAANSFLLTIQHVILVASAYPLAVAAWVDNPPDSIEFIAFLYAWLTVFIVFFLRFLISIVALANGAAVAVRARVFAANFKQALKLASPDIKSFGSYPMIFFVWIPGITILGLLIHPVMAGLLFTLSLFIVLKSIKGKRREITYIFKFSSKYSEVWAVDSDFQRARLPREVEREWNRYP